MPPTDRRGVPQPAAAEAGHEAGPAAALHRAGAAAASHPARHPAQQQPGVGLKHL